MPMTPERFLAQRRPRWSELEERVARARGGALRNRSTSDLERFGILYRQTASDLALARREFPDDPVATYLNDLVGRAHPLIHRGAPLRPGALAGFLTLGIPREFRAARLYVLASLGISLVGVLGGWLAVALRPDIAATIVPQGSLFDRMARGEIPPGTGVGFEDAALIIPNNIRVALVCFAGGALLGIPTAISLLYNGWVLGTLGAAEQRDGVATSFWSYIAPHGVIELSVIVISGATGLMLADAVLRPGFLRRADSLARVSGPAVRLACGAATLLVICGLIESLFSPTAAPAALKYTVGAITGVALYSWLILAGRERASRTRPSLDVPGGGILGTA